MPRGGKRPGAGAPKGNMNAMKHGAYSRQFAQVGALLAQDPAIRRALVDLARKHNLQRQRANEVAALLFTRLFQRADDIASGRLPSPARGRGARGEGNRLNLAIPADDHDSIKIAAGQAALRQIRNAGRRAAKKSKSANVNQNPGTNHHGQSNAPP